MSLNRLIFEQVKYWVSGRFEQRAARVENHDDYKVSCRSQLDKENVSVRMQKIPEP